MKELKLFIDEMQATSSSLDKVAILKKQSQTIQSILEYTYNPYKQYNVTSKTCIKNKDIITPYFGKSIFDLLDDLNTRYITGHAAIGAINYFINKNKKYKELIFRTIDKDLEIRAGAKVINKAFPDLIPEFNVALAQNYKSKLCDFKNEEWYASRKLDGVRCLAVVDENGACTLYSRMGKEFITLNRVKKAIESTNIINTVFDGEICLINKNGDEDFQGVMKQLRRKNHQIENPIFMVFDMLHKSDFDKNKSTETLSDRLYKLRSFIYNNDLETLCYLDQSLVIDKEHFNKWAQIANNNNWEGFMLRKNRGYEGKRSKNLLKVKTFHDAEYTVVDADFGPMAVVRDGKEKQETMLAQVYIEHKGHIVKVGSGFS